MRLNQRLSQRQDPANDRDPRGEGGAEIIDLATRNVLPVVAQQRGRSDAFGLAAGVAIVALLGGVTLWTMNGARTSPEQRNPQAALAQRAEIPPPVPAQAVTPLPAPQPAQQQQPGLAAPAPAPSLSPGANPQSSPTVVFDASALPGVPAPAVAVAAPPTGVAGNPNDDFAARIGGVGGTKATATASIDPKTTVTQGTLIPAVLETAIDTDVPGYVRAVISSDVRSFDGTRVLVPRSSRLIGEYKSGLQAGQRRAYVIWTRLIRPDGVSVNIASPAVAFSGETGLAGKVNNHFFERFGSAMMLSVIGGLSAIGNTAGVVIAGNGQSAAAAAVGQSAQIGPTIRVRQGQPIRVFTARDLDFSKVSTE